MHQKLLLPPRIVPAPSTLGNAAAACLVPMSPPGSPFLTLFIYLFGEPELGGSASPSIPSSERQERVIFHQPHSFTATSAQLWTAGCQCGGREGLRQGQGASSAQQEWGISFVLHTLLVPKPH